MNKNRIKGKWGQLKAKAKVKWAETTHNPQAVAEAKIEFLTATVHECFNMPANQTNDRIESLINTL